MKTINLLVCFLVLMLEIPDMSSQTYTDENAELSNRELVISNNGNPMTENRFFRPSVYG